MYIQNFNCVLLNKYNHKLHKKFYVFYSVFYHKKSYYKEILGILKVKDLLFYKTLLIYKLNKLTTKKPKFCRRKIELKANLYR